MWGQFSIHDVVSLNRLKVFPNVVLSFLRATATMNSFIISTDQGGGWSLTLEDYPLRGNGWTTQWTPHQEDQSKSAADKGYWEWRSAVSESNIGREQKTHYKGKEFLNGIDLT